MLANVITINISSQYPKIGVSLGKIKAIIISQDKTLQIKKVKTEENRLKIKRGKNEYNPTFDPESIFIEHKRFPIPRTNQYVVLVEGKQQVEKLHSNDLFTPLTTKELQELIKREVAKARMKIKPLSLNMFVVLLVVQIITIIMLIMLMSGVHFG
jgi:iron-sulfur cluster repair protein YtfE (RIC family)